MPGRYKQWLEVGGFLLLAGCGVLIWLARDWFDVQDASMRLGMGAGGGGLIGAAVAGLGRIAYPYIRNMVDRRHRGRGPQR